MKRNVGFVACLFILVVGALFVKAQQSRTHTEDLVRLRVVQIQVTPVTDGECHGASLALDEQMFQEFKDATGPELSYDKREVIPYAITTVSLMGVPPQEQFRREMMNLQARCAEDPEYKAVQEKYSGLMARRRGEEI